MRLNELAKLNPKEVTINKIIKIIRDMIYIQPFFMALSKPNENTKILMCALSGIHQMISLNIFNEDDIENISHIYTLYISSRNEEIILKIIQCLNLMINIQFNLTDGTVIRVRNTLLSQLLSFIVSITNRDDIPEISQLASATLSQVNK